MTNKIKEFINCPHCNYTIVTDVLQEPKKLICSNCFLEFTANPKYPEYKTGEAVLYQNGDKFELGIVKTVCGNDEYFIWYHTGDTAARTHARHLYKISNAYAYHIIRLDPDDNERR